MQRSTGTQPASPPKENAGHFALHSLPPPQSHCSAPLAPWHWQFWPFVSTTGPPKSACWCSRQVHSLPYSAVVRYLRIATALIRARIGGQLGSCSWVARAAPRRPSTCRLERCLALDVLRFPVMGSAHLHMEATATSTPSSRCPRPDTPGPWPEEGHQGG